MQQWLLSTLKTTKTFVDAINKFDATMAFIYIENNKNFC
jgi:hypothetical protein